MVKRKPAKVWPQATKQRIVERVKSGERVSAIANDTKIHYSLIYAWMKKAGVIPQTKKGNIVAKRIKDDEDDLVAKAHSQQDLREKLRDALIYLRHARAEIMKEAGGLQKLSRANLLTLLALDSLQG